MKSKKTAIFIISDLFVYKMKIPNKWQIPLSFQIIAKSSIFICDYTLVIK